MNKFEFAGTFCTLCDGQIEYGQSVELVCHRCIPTVFDKAKITLLEKDILLIIQLIYDKFSSGLDSKTHPTSSARELLELYDRLLATYKEAYNYTIVSSSE